MAEGYDESSGYDEKIAAIARDEDDSSDEVKTKHEANDENFFGFCDLEGYVYRVCRANEVVSNGIYCQDPKSNRTINQHVAHGSTIPSKYISTTASHEVALLWAFYEMNTDCRNPRQEPLPIVKIKLRVLEDTDVENGCANLNNEKVREHFIKGATHRNFAKASKEVIFTGHIPKFIMPNHDAPISIAATPQVQSFKSEGLNADDLVHRLRQMKFETRNDPQLVYWSDDNMVMPPQPPPKKKMKKTTKK